MFELTMQLNEHPGRLLVFTGVDGAGKTTLLNQAQEYLQTKNISCHVTKMPSDRVRNLKFFRDFHDSHDEGERLAVSPFALTVLVSGDRLIVHETEVLPALKSGHWVLCDRYAYTGLVICSDPVIKDLANRFTQPDRTFLAQASAGVVEQRVRSRPQERELYYDREAVTRQMQVYDRLAHQNGFITLCTEEPFETVRSQLYAHLDELLCRPARTHHHRPLQR